MLSAFNVAVLANTQESAPSITKVQLPLGTITRVWVQFPSGCANLVRARILQGATQVWPRDEDEDLRADGETIAWDDQYPVATGNDEFDLWLVNLDDTYPHTISFRFQISAPAVSSAAPSGPGVLDRLRSALS